VRSNKAAVAGEGAEAADVDVPQVGAGSPPTIHSAISLPGAAAVGDAGELKPAQTK
jgi:hypothetical protein